MLALTLLSSIDSQMPRAQGTATRGLTMTPNQSIDGPAHWRQIEATNGYDVDSGLLRTPVPVPLGLPPRSRSVRTGQALGRFLSAVSAAQRRRKRPVGHAAAMGSNA